MERYIIEITPACTNKEQAQRIQNAVSELDENLKGDDLEKGLSIIKNNMTFINNCREKAKSGASKTKLLLYIAGELTRGNLKI